jgi:hypothetical protein
VRVTFDPQRRADGTYRLESLLTGALTRYATLPSLAGARVSEDGAIR